jgi:methylphosphotriester-DNA--protein-cysteine methyltransferase
MPRVARALGVTKRTLHRPLAARQESFAAIVDDARAGLAERYLATDHYTISDVVRPAGLRRVQRVLPMVPTAVRDQPDRLAGGDHRIRHPDLTGAFCRPAQPGPPRTAACLGCALPSLVSR